MDTLELSLDPVSVAVSLRQGDRKEVVLVCEMTAAERGAYLDEVRERVTPEGKAIKSLAGLQSKLLSLCLRRASDRSAIPEQEIEKWPATVVQRLFDEAQRINGLLAQDLPKKE
jgi:hypothetical protein